jgi:hypothetical protein
LIELFASRRKFLRCFLLYRKGLAMTRIISERPPKGHRDNFTLGHCPMAFVDFCCGECYGVV